MTDDVSAARHTPKFTRNRGKPWIALARKSGERMATSRMRCETFTSAPGLWPRFLVNFGVWRAALIGRGCDQRVADQLGTLLAGRDVLLYDEPSTGPAVADEIDRFEEWILAAMEDETEGEGREALNHLLGSQFENAPGTQRITISRALLSGCCPLLACSARICST